MERRTRWLLLCIAAAASLLIGAWEMLPREPELHWNGPAVTPTGAAGSPSAPAASASLAGFPRLVATSPEEVREVVHFCRAAGDGELLALRAAALESEDPLVAGNALRALGRLHAVAKDPDLIALVGDERLRVRQEVVVALGNSGYPPVVADLLPLLDEDDPAVRPLVIRALGRVGGESARTRLRALVDGANASAVDHAFARAALRESIAKH